MGSPLVVRVVASVGIQMVGDPSIGSSSFSLPVDTDATVFKTGSGNGTANSVYASGRTLAASASETLDLSTGLEDPTGGALAFTNIKGMYISANAGNTGNIIVGDAASDPFTGPLGSATDTVTLKPGAQMLVSDPAGWAVTSGTNNNLKVANSDSVNPGLYTIILFG